MKKLIYIFILFIGLLACTSVVIGQGVGINPSGNNPDPSAILDASSTNKGMLIPRLSTTERDAIASPANSLLIYNTTSRCLEIYANGLWQSVFCTACPLPSAVTASASPNPICAGSTLTLTGNAILATNWSWTGPNGFTSTLQNPTISSITSAGAGVYTLTASNNCGSAAPVNTASVTVNTVPSSAPAAGTHTPSQTQIVWNWNTVSGATGYKYNTVNTYSSAIDNGANTSYTQTGLTCNTPYTLYVWAYNNGCGNSASILLSQTTSSCCPEGTGGTITHIGGNTIHTFTSSGTFTPGCSGNIEVLVVAGGGGGSGWGGGGGGAGGLLYSSSYAVTVQSYTVTVGDGGAGAATTPGSNGSNSVFGTLTAIGGGGGGRANGLAGGSGGGGGSNDAAGVAYSGGGGTGGQGTAGGNSRAASPWLCGGGGGAGESGWWGSTSSGGGKGGDGLQYSISGAPVYYAGGGGGATYCCSSLPGGAGGNGGGGNGCGGNSSCVPGAGAPNTGGGGGGDNQFSSILGGAGGSGIVIISYPTP